MEILRLRIVQHSMHGKQVKCFLAFCWYCLLLLVVDLLSYSPSSLFGIVSASIAFLSWIKKGLDCVLVSCWSRTYSANRRCSLLAYRQSICWARVLLGIRRHGKHNENDAFVLTIFCSWTHSVTVVHWLQTINLTRAGLAIGEHGKEHNRTEIMASQLLFSHQLTLQILPSTDNKFEQWEWAAGSFAMNWSTGSSNRDSCNYYE